MTDLQATVVAVLGIVAYLGIVLCVAVAIGLSIREADRRERPGSEEPAPVEPSPLSVDVAEHHQRTDVYL